MKEDFFLQYCEKVILEKEKGDLRVEAAARKICALVTEDFPDSAKEIISYACELEIPREMSVGAGINIGDKWDEQEAAAYKEKGWEKLVWIIKKNT